MVLCYRLNYNVSVQLSEAALLLLRDVVTWQHLDQWQANIWKNKSCTYKAIFGRVKDIVTRKCLDQCEM